MATNLRNMIRRIFRSNIERVNTNNVFKPDFYRFIGAEDEQGYNDILKTIEEKCKENGDKCIIFDNIIPLTRDLQLIEYIQSELGNMNVLDMVHEEIAIFEDDNINNRFLKAMDYVVPLAIKNERFTNENIRNNFITKVIIWSYTLLREIDFNGEINPKCIYYGKIKRHEIYFLILLYLMNFDVIYINPFNEEYWNEIDCDKLCEVENFNNTLSIDSFKIRADKGNVIESVETITKQIQREVEKELFSNTGMFKPWQFRNGYTKSLLLDTILEDIFIYWNEPSKMREGFKVEGDLVKIPCFFKKIDGQYGNLVEYQKLIKHCTESSNTLFFNHGNISYDEGIKDYMYQLSFFQTYDGTFDIEQIKKVSFYRFKKYSEEVQNFLLKKFNETIKDNSLYVRPLTREDHLNLLVMVIFLNEEIVKLVDNFDFTSNVPKIVIYLDNEDTISDSILMLLGYIHKIGIDIVIFNPSGLLNIKTMLKEDRVNINRLEEMNYNLEYKKVISYKQGFFSRILSK